MYDDVTLALIPPDAEAVAGYVNGRYRNYQQVLLHWPHAKHKSIDVRGDAFADCLDVEPGDATNATAPGWYKRQAVQHPTIYTSASNVPALIRTMALAGIPRGKYRIWSAHYTFHAHVCGPRCGFGNWYADATQHSDKSHGKSLDESLCHDSFFDIKRKPVKNGFVYWAQWVKGGRTWRRPGSAPARVPADWWKRLPGWLKAHRR